MNLSVVKKPPRIPEVGEIFICDPAEAGNFNHYICIRIPDELGWLWLPHRKDDDNLFFAIELNCADEFITSDWFLKKWRFIILKPINNGAIFEPR